MEEEKNFFDIYWMEIISQSLAAVCIISVAFVFQELWNWWLSKFFGEINFIVAIVVSVVSLWSFVPFLQPWKKKEFENWIEILKTNLGFIAGVYGLYLCGWFVESYLR